MDVQAQDSGLQHAPTGAVPASARTQAITFHDPVYSDTAPTPVVAFRPPERGRADGAGVRLLRAAIVVVVLALLACGAVLGLVKAGVIDHSGGSGTGNSATHATTAPQSPLAVPTGSGPQAATYAVDAAAFHLTVTTGPGEAWVSVGLIGQHPVFAGVISPHTSKGFVLLGSSQAEVGAGGTTLTLMAGQRTATLTPPSAPFTYQLTAQPARA